MTANRVHCIFPPKASQCKVLFVVIGTKRSLGSQLPQSGVSETGQADVKETVYRGGFGLSRTGYPVETSAATVVWQQSTNTLLWRCIASWTETKTVTTPTWWEKNQDFPLISGQLRSAHSELLRRFREVSSDEVNKALLFNIFQKQWLEHGPCGFLCRTAFLYMWEDSIIDLPFHIKVSQMQGRKQLIQ